jgi:hypothetical protein
VSTYDDSGLDPDISYCYRVVAKPTGSTSVPSAYSGWTSSSLGAGTPPDAPTGLSPAGGTMVDPKVVQALTWTHNPTDGTAQTQFEVRHRQFGSGSWTSVTPVTSATSSWTLPANTYANDKTVEWQVRTWGHNATESPWSASATITTSPAVAP